MDQRNQHKPQDLNRQDVELSNLQSRQTNQAEPQQAIVVQAVDDYDQEIIENSQSFQPGQSAQGLKEASIEFPRRKSLE